jgi:polar amino acid transport system permease protein
MEYTFHWRPVFRNLPDLLEAGLLTLEVAVEAMLVGIVLGLALAMIRMSGRRSISWFATSWVEIARNTPALLQLFFFGFGLGAFGIHLSPFWICLCALSFNNAGYLAENAYLRIVIPQVLRIVYHPMTNQMVWSVLMSSLGMLVGFRELTGETQFLASKTFRIFEYFLVTAVIYYVIVKFILAGSRVLSWRLFRY